MEYKYLKRYLDENEITITDLSKCIGVSRQAIYGWENKGIIPQKYNNVISDMCFFGYKCKCKLEFEISYDKCNSKFILDPTMDVELKDDEIIVSSFDDLGVSKRVVLDKKICNISNSNFDFDGFNIKLNIFRYETNIDYLNRKIKYTLYCSSDIYEKKKISSMYNNLLFNFKSNILSQEFSEFKDIINYVKLAELDIVMQVSTNEMEMLHQYNKEFKDSNISAMGMYLKYNDEQYDYLYSILGNKFEKIIKYYNGYYEYLNIIFICRDNIKSNIKYLESNYSSNIDDLSLTFRNDGLTIGFLDMLNIVFCHECGHLVFSYQKSKNKTFGEKCANYFVSYIYNGKYDYFNLFFTNLQPYIYHYPLVKPDIELMYNKIYNNDNILINTFDELYENYNEEVDKLYEG